MKFQNKREFIIYHKAFEEGMVKAYRSIMLHAKVAMQAHRKEMTKKRTEEIANINNHLWSKL